MARMSDPVTLRELEGLSELKASEAFQRRVWGEADPADNADLLLALQHEGGLVAGAFDEGRMVGFVFGFPTVDRAVQHSHRLGVDPHWQGRGLGVRLKLFQKDWCLKRGISLVRWTYDPIRRPNAVLNIARLGAVASTYYRNYYGDMEGINAGVPSDRLLAEWHLDGKPAAQAPKARVAIPHDFAAMQAADLEAALSERLRVRHDLEAAFADGLRVVGFDTAENAYLLT
jgi:predicted GNAT superfamily acetyltransferase